MENILKSLEKYKPVLIDAFEKRANHVFINLVERFGDNFKGIYNSELGTYFNNFMKPMLTNKVLDTIKVRVKAVEYADATVITWLNKIKSKLEQLDYANVYNLDQYSFSITGKRQGYNISITQDMIINVSVKGKLFNQFPARIYVDGKSMSEAKYKKMFI